MTPFEMAVFSLLFLFTLTNFDDYVRRDDGSVPRWYVLAVSFLIASTIVTSASALLTGVF